MSIFNENDRKLKKLKRIAGKVEELASVYSAMSDEELRGQTAKFKERLKGGETLDDLLPEAFATVREASTRVLGLRHYPVQIIGGVALHQGRIAEMGTGEGKTLVATLPAYLNALTGDGVHVVTVNDYLATRDANWMGNVYKFLGLTVGVVVPGQTPEEKRNAYQCDITYCTNNELGFDFLRDNMVVRKSDKMQRKLNFAIIDEVDSILIDEARTPLIISGRGGKSSELYKSADNFARQCRPDVDFVIDEKEKSIMLTDDGVAKAERFFNISNLTGGDNSNTEIGVEGLGDVVKNTELNNHIQQALKAHYMMKKDKDYIVSDGEVLIVDEFTGRIMIGRRYSEGLHQAIEAKERVHVRSENKTLATITFQNFFRMYAKLSGMTGTAKTEEEEFKGIYALDVVTIPPNKPSRRVDEQDKIYTKVPGKLNAIVADIIEHHKSGQPILVGTVSVEKSEQLSEILKSKHIPHNVLNAKYHKQEAEIIAQAGKLNAVTIATNMAGRGTDIMLGGNPEYQARQRMEKDGYPLDIIELAVSPYHIDRQEVIEAKEVFKHHYDEFKKRCDAEKEQVVALGGLRIIGTERHESRRIDNQLRGRSGRQGDPGSSVFYISMEDDVARIFGGDKMKSIAEAMKFDDDMPISNAIITKSIERAQKQVEGRNYSIRKQVLSYDDVMNAQRELIYKERGKVLDGLDVHDQIIDMVGELADEILDAYTENYKTDYTTWDYAAFNAALEKRLLPEGTNLMNEELCSCYDVKKLKDAVMKVALDDYKKKEDLLRELGGDIRDIERLILLRTVDSKWMDHIDAMDALRRGIGLRGYGQRDPVIAYRQEGWDMFEDMVKHIHLDTAAILMKLSIAPKEGNAKVSEKIASAKKSVAAASKNIGRNDPCPCGSGLKYKNCCGKNK